MSYSSDYNVHPLSVLPKWRGGHPSH